MRIPELIVGGNTLTQVVAELSIAEQGMFASTRYEGNLGGDLWRRFTVTLDYAKGRMCLVPNGAFAEPFVGPRSGLTPSIVDGAVRVVELLAKSPASEAGLNAGDTAGNARDARLTLRDLL